MLSLLYLVFTRKNLVPRNNSKTGMQDFQIPGSESINKKDVQNVSSTVNSRGFGIDTSAKKNMMQNIKGQEPSTKQVLDIHQQAINRNSLESQATFRERDTDPMRNLVLSKSLANSDAHRVEINPETLDSLVDKLKERMEDTHRIISKEFSQSLQEQLVSTIHDKSNAGTEQINTALLRLDEVMTDFKSVVTLDGERLRNEESKLSQLHVSTNSTALKIQPTSHVRASRLISCCYIKQRRAW